MRPPSLSWSKSGWGTFVRSARDDDRVKRSGLGPALIAVADSRVDVGVAQLFVHLGGALGKRRVDLDRVHLLDQPREDRRLIARTRADLVDPIGRLGVEHLGHEGDVVRGSDRLAFADRDRFVVIGLSLGLGRQEAVARHGPERVEHARVLDAALDQVPLDHPVAGRRGRVVARLRPWRARSACWS